MDQLSIEKDDHVTDRAALFQRCCALLQARDKAAAGLLPALEAHADYAPGWCALSAVLREAGQGAAAAVAAERAVAAAPGSERGWFLLGLARQDVLDHLGAAEAYQRALALRPERHEAALNMGIALQESRRFEAALDAYAMCYRLNPKAFGRIAQAVVSAPVGRLWLDLDDLRAVLAARA